jgi:ubiquitin carboxyl-terminal hydrolase 14
MLYKYLVSVNIKWGKEKFSDVECNTDDPPMVFKAQLFALSGVQPDRQKVMLKGAVVKVFVNENWDNLIMTSSMNY